MREALILCIHFLEFGVPDEAEHQTRNVSEAVADAEEERNREQDAGSQREALFREQPSEKVEHDREERGDQERDLEHETESRAELLTELLSVRSSRSG